MKVLQINSVCGNGSTGRIATDLHYALETQGHESYIAYGRNEAVNCSSTIKIGTKYDNYLHGIRTRMYDAHGLGSSKATENFILKAKTMDPDIIHLHNIHGYYMNYEILFEYLKQTNKPVFWTLHDCWAFTGHCAYFDYVGCNKWEKECFECPQKKSYPSSLMDNSKRNFVLKKKSFTGVKNLTIITPSEWLARKVKESFLNEYPVKVVNNGIDLEKFKPTKSNFKEKYNIQDKKVILGVANTWEDRKGYRTFIELSKLINLNTVIILVGLTETQIKTLPENIIGMKRTANIEDLVELYSIADVCANPSVEETFGLVTIESMACGTPVIVYNATASPELVDETVGRVIDKNDIIQFAKEINEIIEEGKDAYTENCLSKVKKYEKKNIYNRILTLYGDQLNLEG